MPTCWFTEGQPGFTYSVWSLEVNSVWGGGGVVGRPKCTRTALLIQPVDFISQPTREENKTKQKQTNEANGQKGTEGVGRETPPMSRGRRVGALFRCGSPRSDKNNKT